jgi:PEP-CTERM motif
MKNTRFSLKGMATMAACLIGASVYGGTIVPDLNDASAVYSSTTATPLTNTVIASQTLANGVTLAASFTPNATDIANSANGPVAVLEIGGSSNGTGLWIIGGNLWFLSKGTSAPKAVPSSTLDLDGSTKVIGVQLDPITADVQLNVYASLDTANDSLLISQNSSVITYALSNVASTWNWQGNDSVSFGIADPTLPSGGNMGWCGALADLAAGTSPFSDNSAQSLNGNVSLGQIFNAVSTVPEPSTLALGVLGGAAVLFLRRRRS